MIESRFFMVGPQLIPYQSEAVQLTAQVESLCILFRPPQKLLQLNLPLIPIVENRERE